MKIRRFLAKSLNGHLNLNVNFRDQLTFVTGINGSGKTSVLNCIAALLLPRFEYFSAIHFDRFTVELQDEERKRVRIFVSKNEGLIRITCSKFSKKHLSISPLQDIGRFGPAQARDYEEDYYREILSRNAGNPILEYIESLPAPMYLGLDRRSLSTGGDRARYERRPPTRERLRRNIFGRSLEEGLADALYFAREQFQEDRRQELALDEDFRKKLVLTLIDFPPVSFFGRIQEPSLQEQKRFREARSNLHRLATLLSVEQETISSKVDPLFDFLEGRLDIIRKGSRRKRDNPSRKQIEALIDWSYNKNNLDKVTEISELISEYNDEVGKIKRRVNNYLHTVNQFVEDSGKKIKFNAVGNLRFTLGDKNEERHIRTLSSGEIQMVVILTHLYFNSEVERANVFIIDEPELSLHVEWQEKFVDAVIEASESTQFILATHSPSIILDKVDHCVELTK